MTQPIDYRTPDIPLDFSNRKSGLLVFGIMMIVMGALSGCIGILAPIGLIVQQRMGPVGQPTTPPATMAMAMGVYGLAATALIWMGIGSIQARRWTRPIVLCVGTLAITMGVLSLISMAINLPGMSRAMQAAQPAGSATLPAAAVAAVAVGMVVAVIVMYILIPGACVWFYRSEHVRQTLEYYDPRPRWTDGCPLPVLGISIAYALFATAMLVGAVQDILPVFGILLTGLAASAGMLLLAGILVMTAILVFRRSMAGWWLAVAIVVLFQFSWAISLLRLDMAELVAATGTPPAQARAMLEAGAMNPPLMLGMTLVISLAGLIYLLRARKYFTGSATLTTSMQ